MTPSTSANWLVALLLPELTFSLASDEPGPRFVVDGVQCRAMQLGAVGATFDRLLDKTGQFIGIQVWPVAAAVGEVLQRLPRRPYLNFPSEGSCFQLYFSEGYPEVESSGVQSLIGDLYQARSGEFAVAVNISYLIESEADRAAIRNVAARWVTLISN